MRDPDETRTDIISAVDFHARLDPARASYRVQPMSGVLAASSGVNVERDCNMTGRAL